MDHATPWRNNGITSHDNLDSLCKIHNGLKEQPGWQFTYDSATDVLTITTPAGRIHHAPPEPLIPPEPAEAPPSAVEKNDLDDPMCHPSDRNGG